MKNIVVNVLIVVSSFPRSKRRFLRLGYVHTCGGGDDHNFATV